MKTITKGFTLIELLIVIGIIAVLGTVVVLTLNPAELLRQSRDSNRISDMATMKSVMALYLADVSGASYSIGNGANCYVRTTSPAIGAGTGCGLGSGVVRFAAGTNTETASAAVSGAGWIPANLTLISSGAPVSALPVDPVNSNAYYYAYRAGGANGMTCTTGSSCVEYELNSNMESTKFANDATDTDSVEENDGGNANDLYEVGTSQGLAL